ncbi:unnamed protein product [Gemmata massiliana]|uniref:Uncharacterized protein n=1 Tax=Gemmata massiliana TaxID=1210884 RepID=A0A6P2D6F8_9BACT|nr:hypothetical protein [Gemmata massiliana]VTR95052.1 unnamed protein product [Gemmata massiliana]
MYSSLVLSTALLAPAAPIPRDSGPSTTGPAPRVLALKADESGTVRVIYTVPIKQTVTSVYFEMEGNQQVQKQIEHDVVNNQYFNKSLPEFSGKFTTANGTPLTADEAAARVKKGATVLASSDGKPIGKTWLRSVAPDTVIMVADGLSHANIQWGGAPYPTTPTPQLTMLTTDDKGAVVVPTTSQPVNNNGYYNEVMWDGGGRAIRVRGGRFIGDSYYGGGEIAEAKVAPKPLSEVKFDAYDVRGKLVSKSEVQKRLAAGGMVIVAGDGQMPDETYLKGFHDDVLVLVGAELVIPITPIDQTKKKQNGSFVKRNILPVEQTAPAVDLPRLRVAPVLRAGVIKG